MKGIIKHLQNNRINSIIQTRNQIKQVTRSFLGKKGFIEIDTPILGPKIPEYTNNQFKVLGERGEVYYLPQSPQIYKQILKNAGYKK